mgnify:CR=1 FL=1
MIHTRMHEVNRRFFLGCLCIHLFLLRTKIYCKQQHHHQTKAEKKEKNRVNKLKNRNRVKNIKKTESRTKTKQNRGGGGEGGEEEEEGEEEEGKKQQVNIKNKKQSKIKEQKKNREKLVIQIPSTFPFFPFSLQEEACFAIAELFCNSRGTITSHGYVSLFFFSYFLIYIWFRLFLISKSGFRERQRQRQRDRVRVLFATIHFLCLLF